MSVWHCTGREEHDVLCQWIAKVVRADTYKLPLWCAAHIVSLERPIKWPIIGTCEMLQQGAQNWNWHINLNPAVIAEEFSLYLDCPAGLTWCWKSVFIAAKWRMKYMLPQTLRTKSLLGWLGRNENRNLAPLRLYPPYKLMFISSQVNVHNVHKNSQESGKYSLVRILKILI